MTGAYAPASDSTDWLTVTGVTNGVVSFSFTAPTTNRTGHIIVLGISVPVIQQVNFSLLEGPGGGSDGIVLQASGAWTASANDNWLHLTAANQTGTNSVTVAFTFDANPGATRVGTLTIAGMTVTVTQAGSTYLPAQAVTMATNALQASFGVAVDGSGNVFFDYRDTQVWEWLAASQLFNRPPIMSGVTSAAGLAVDSGGDLWVADRGASAICELVPGNGTAASQVIWTGLNHPCGVAVDSQGEIYVADTGDNAIKFFGLSGQTTLVSGLNSPCGVALDAANNVYIADTDNGAIKEWAAASQTLSTLVSTGLDLPSGVALDGAGNVYIADTGDNAIKMWNPISGNVTTLASSGLNQPCTVAVSPLGCLVIADTGNKTIKAVPLPPAYVSTALVTEGWAAGSDALPPVLPATTPLTGRFAPTSDASWLTITGTNNGVVSFSFTAATTNRIGHINLLGQAITIYQGQGTAAAVLLGNLTQTYDGTAKPVSVTTTPPGLAVSVTYNGLPNAPTNLGSYCVAATVNAPGCQGGTNGILTITPVSATVTLGNFTQAYDGAAEPVSVTTAPPGLPVSVTYNGLPNAPTNIGTYNVMASVTDPNYRGAASGTLVIYHATVHYVAQGASNPVWPYATWATAATSIQDAVDATWDGDLVLVTNGVYSTGGRPVPGTLTNRAAIDRAITVMSINGPAATTIWGWWGANESEECGPGAVRCAYVGTNAVLSGFTLANGYTDDGSSGDSRDQCGGGAWCEPSAVLTNCVTTGNYGNFTWLNGGGAYGGTLNNCTISGNFAYGGGGGAYGCTLNNCTISRNGGFSGGGGASWSTLNNCTISGNFSVEGTGGGAYGGTLNNCIVSGNEGGTVGGAYGSTLNNCTISGNYLSGVWPFGYGGVQACTVANSIIFGNSGPTAPNYDTNSTLINCCATPLAPGPGNIAADPAFLNTNGLSTLRLSSNSPCINSGNNAFAAGPTDLDGNPRIAGGTVDMGAYEFQSPASILAYAWAQQYALPTDGSADALDLDGTGMANWQKSVAGLNPTNPASVLVMSAVAPHGPAGLTVTWASVNNRWYLLQQSTNLSASPAFWTVQSNILGQAGVTSYTNAAATNGGPYFYRVGVQ